MLYFAYGSNLNVKAMRRRCPAAKPLTAARLVGYRLQFQTYCAIVPDAKHSVPGALFELTPACVRALDRYEGDAFRQITLTVNRSDTGEDVDAMAYEKITPGKTAPPSMDYVRQVAAGYRDWGLDERVLRRARYDTLGIAAEAPTAATPRPDTATGGRPRRGLWDPSENSSGALDGLLKPPRR